MNEWVFVVCIKTPRDTNPGWCFTSLKGPSDLSQLVAMENTPKHGDTMFLSI